VSATGDLVGMPTLRAATAAELMTPNPVSVRQTATVREAAALLIDRGISAAPVIDDAGRPVGVVSQSDILVHDRERTEHLSPAHYFTAAELRAGPGPEVRFPDDADRTTVSEVMTPMVYGVRTESTSAEVVRQMLALRVHRLFVADASGVLVGVVSTFDILRHLQV
jgi:CBS domain-containing protein